MKIYMIGNRTAILAFECENDTQTFISNQSTATGLKLWSMDVITKTKENVLNDVTPDILVDHRPV